MTWQWIWQRDRHTDRSHSSVAPRTLLQEAPAQAFASLPRIVTTPAIRAQPRIPCSALGMP